MLIVICYSQQFIDIDKIDISMLPHFLSIPQVWNNVELIPQRPGFVTIVLYKMKSTLLLKTHQQVTLAVMDLLVLSGYWNIDTLYPCDCRNIQRAFVPDKRKGGMIVLGTEFLKQGIRIAGTEKGVHNLVVASDLEWNYKFPLLLIFIDAVWGGVVGGGSNNQEKEHLMVMGMHLLVLLNQMQMVYHNYGVKN
jgi:hypothetical protein